MKVGQHFRVSDGGMIINATNRTIKALLDLENDYIQWSSENKRQNIVQYMENRLPNCVGFLDGCHIPLYETPLDDHQSYFSRKQEYSIQLQAVCDNDLTIRQLSVAFPGSVHDARVFSNTPIGQTIHEYLTGEQWIAADSAYKLTEQVITPYRDNSVVGSKRQRMEFNRHFSGYRVKIEQTFGICKNLWSSFKNLRVRVDRVNGHRRACEWIIACCILYNLLKPKEYYEMENDGIDCTEEENDNYPQLIAKEKRKSLMDLVTL